MGGAPEASGHPVCDVKCVVVAMAPHSKQPAGAGPWAPPDARSVPPDTRSVPPAPQVHLVSEHIWCEDFLVRSLYLKNLRSGETRTVTQFHFLSWYDQGVPSSTRSLLDFRRYGEEPAAGQRGGRGRRVGGASPQPRVCES